MEQELLAVYVYLHELLGWLVTVQGHHLLWHAQGIHALRGVEVVHFQQGRPDYRLLQWHRGRVGRDPGLCHQRGPHLQF